MKRTLFNTIITTVWNMWNKSFIFVYFRLGFFVCVSPFSLRNNKTIVSLIESKKKSERKKKEKGGRKFWSKSCNCSCKAQYYYCGGWEEREEVKRNGENRKGKRGKKKNVLTTMCDVHFYRFLLIFTSSLCPVHKRIIT